MLEYFTVAWLKTKKIKNMCTYLLGKKQKWDQIYFKIRITCTFYLARCNHGRNGDIKTNKINKKKNVVFISHGVIPVETRGNFFKFCMKRLKIVLSDLILSFFFFFFRTPKFTNTIHPYKTCPALISCIAIRVEDSPITYKNFIQNKKRQNYFTFHFLFFLLSLQN